MPDELEAREAVRQAYQAYYRRLVAALYALTGDFAEAQDLVQEAYARALRSERSVRLYRDTILKAADANVKAAQAAYTTGKIPFLSLIEAQRNAISLRDRYYEAIADYFRRRATLERVTGGPLASQQRP